MGLYRRMYGSTIEPVFLSKCQFHGSEVRDALINLAKGSYFVDDQAEKLIREWVEEGVVQTLQKAPTHSQAAFIGLQYSNKTYKEAVWGPGIIEHYWYKVL